MVARGAFYCPRRALCPMASVISERGEVRGSDNAGGIMSNDRIRIRGASCLVRRNRLMRICHGHRGNGGADSSDTARSRRRLRTYHIFVREGEVGAT